MKDKKENLALKRFINLVYISIVAVIFCVLIRLLFQNIFYSYKPNPNLYVKYDLTKQSIPDPIQKQMDYEFLYFDVRGETVQIKEKYTYDITGKVEGIQDYDTTFFGSFMSLNGKGIYDYISPIDIAFSWGDLAKEKNSGHFYANQYYLNSSRKVYFRADSYLCEKYGKDYIKAHCSNNHIVTLDSDLKRELSKIKVADIVRLKGYLVDVKVGYGQPWESSILRTDGEGHKGCEIMYVEDVVIMP